MAIKISVMKVLGLAIGLFSIVAAVPGTATFYTSYITPPSCYGYQNMGVMVTAASDAIWDNQTACGRMYRVTCTGPTNKRVPEPCRGSVTVKVVDYCPRCQATFDLSKEAFTIIADPNAGKVKIDYARV